ncbi:ADP-ribose pyrophosphatase [Clostridia bacterium]|nr:ADP-ribose pyrophosphatase [Clostridia bacterium]
MHIDKDGLTEEQFLARYNSSDFDRISLCVDAVIFGVYAKADTENYRKSDEQKITVLLVRRTEHPFIGKWALPGGFVGVAEPLEETAERVVKSKTGMDNIYLEQLGTFGDTQRDPRMRIVSTAYLSLVDKCSYSTPSANAAWFDVVFELNGDLLVLSNKDEKISFSVKTNERQNGKVTAENIQVQDGSAIAFDHAQIILQGLLRLRGKIDYTDIVFNLLPNKFTISQLQQIYEIILGHKLLSPVFRRKLADKIKAVGEFTHEKGHRPSQLFSYKGGLFL